MDFNVAGKRAEVYETQFGRYLFYPTDLVSNTIINGKFWEEELRPVFDAHLNKQCNVIEVGSYIGDHTVYLSKLCNKVYAFEPQRHVFHQLCANLFLNKCGNVDAKELLVYDGSKLRLATIDEADQYAIPQSEIIFTDPLGYENNDNASGIFFKPDGKVNIKTVRLDDIIPKKEHIEMIITDAEGSDLPILRGAKEIIKKNYPMIVFEFNIAGAEIHRTTFADYQTFFSELGYRITQIGHWNWVAEHV